MKKTTFLVTILCLLLVVLAGCNNSIDDTISYNNSNENNIANAETNEETQAEQNPENGRSEQNGITQYLLDAPLSIEEIWDLFDESFEVYADYLASVRGLEAFYSMVFQFENLPSGRVADTPIADVIAMYEEINAALNFVSVGSHLVLGYIERFYHGAEFVQVQPGSSLEHEINRWVANDGYGNAFYHTPLMASFISPSVFHRFDEHISLGRNLQAADGRVSRNEPISVVLGYGYKGIFEIGEIISLYYISTKMNFQVVGFLNPNVSFYFGLGAHEKVLLDYRIIVPHFVPDYEPVGDAEIWQISFHVGELLSGYIAVMGSITDLTEDSWEYYQALIDEIATRHGLLGVIRLDSVPSGIIWP